jgi:hypothetical protein
MNKEHKLPLTGGIPQPLTSLRDCMVAAECECLGCSASDSEPS